MFRVKSLGKCLPIAGLMLVAACEGETGRPVFPSYDQTLLQLVEANPDLSQFLDRAKLVGLDVAMGRNQATYTIIAPSNAAFGAAQGLPTAEDPDGVSELVRFHMLAGTIDYDLLSIGGEFKTITGTTVRIEPSGSGFEITDFEGNTAMITKAAEEARASNGVLHVISAVLTPPPPPVVPLGTLAEELDAAGFAAALEAAAGTALEDALSAAGPYTVFAPSDEALGMVDLEGVDPAVVENILLHHVVSGSNDADALAMNPALTSLAGLPLVVEDDGATVGAAMVGDTVVEASNGIAYGLDGVIVPPTALAYAGETPRLMQTAAAATRVGMDVAALTPDTLMDEPPVTIFAPSNMAWMNAGIDPATASTATVAEILLSHTVRGQVLLEDLTDGQTLDTLSGTVAVDITDMVITLSRDGFSARLTPAESDIRTLTGALHVVEGILE
jgi:uncharacterized surface protein with fasciclin (FAS1) repeats